MKTLRNTILSVLLLCILMSLPSCYLSKKINYYSQRDNYITATGTVIHIKYNEDNSSLYLAFSELDPKFDDINFKIVGANLPIVQENGIDEKIELGDQVEFISAPKYFGDGYVMPIVAISVDGETLLDFEEGFSNWLNLLEGK